MKTEKFKLSVALSRKHDIEKIYNPELPSIEVKGSKNRVLFLFDHLDDDEYKQNKLMVGLQGKLLTNLVNKAKSTFIVDNRDKTFSWTAINFLDANPKGLNKHELYDYCLERVLAYCKQWKPTSIICFSQRFMRYFYPEKFDSHGYENYGKYLGSLVFHKGLSIFPVIDLMDILNAKGEESLAGALGIISRCIANGICGRIQFKVNTKEIDSAKIHMVESIPSFKTLIKKLSKAQYISIDTETTNLNVIQNKLLTIQFCMSPDEVYILPFYHKDSPFSGSDFDILKKRLKRFFEGKNQAKWLIFHNANFDLNVLRVNLEIDFYANKIWDTIASTFALDENWKYINGAPGIDFKPYSLEALSIRYGHYKYGEETIAKGDSKNIGNKSLSDPLVKKYMAYDVLLPMAIHKQQIAEANFLKYKKFVSVVTEQISDMLLSFNEMNINGLPVDVDYLLYLNSKKSPILTVLRELEDKIYTCKEAISFNKELVAEENIPTTGLFGAVKSWLFDIHKREHKTRFFFDKLKLKPLKYGKPDKHGKRIGKVDKGFQEHYADVPLIKIFTNFSKAEKLRDAFVKSFIKLLKASDDFKYDFCVRPYISFKDVVTGRVSERDPNCQQIPSRSELGKHIKRLFIAPPGMLFIKVDYSAHEVRGLALISWDTVLAEAFRIGYELRKKFKLRPSKELEAELDAKGDVHKQNACFFFSKTIDEITKELRNAIKGVVFGLIYGKGNKSLSRDIDKPIDFVVDLVTRFFKRFSKGGQWLHEVEAFAQKHHWVESPLGRRRNLTSYLLPKQAETASALYGAMDRRARNSPIQGMGSDFGFIGYRRIVVAAYKRFKETGKKPLKVCNTVHDSLETLAYLHSFIFALNSIEYELTEGVQKTCIERHNFKFVIPLEIDIEIGPTLRDCKKWNGDLLELLRLVAEGLAFQKLKLNYEGIKIKQTLRDLLDQKDDMPVWLRGQYDRLNTIDLDTITKNALKKIKDSEYK